MSEFSDCFGEIETFKNTHHIEIKDNVSPVVTPVKKIPLALKPKLEKKLKRIVVLDIIELVQIPINWINGLAVVEKPNGNIWVCLDLIPFNKAIKREHLHCRRNLLPNVRRILFFKASGANYEDDLVVWGKTLQEPEKRFSKVFLKIRESCLKLNKTKCQIRKQ